MTVDSPLPPIAASNGSRVAVRLLTHDDGELLIDFFYKLSPNSRYSRFHSTLENLDAATIQHEVQPFLNVDGVDRVALVAVIQEAGREALIGVTRLVRGPGPQEAEVAVVVRDDWQRRRIGSGLMERLAMVAKTLDITSFWAMIMSNNRAALNIFSGLNVPLHTDFEHGEAYVRVALEDVPT